jgi:6-phosphofructokinase 1
MSDKGNLLYAQSGGVTAVINASAGAVIEAARRQKRRIGTVFAAKNGILGALREELYDLGGEDLKQIRALAHTPGGAFGSCRYKLPKIEADRAPYERLIEVFRAHDIRWFLYNGGGDSADTALKLSQIGAELDYPLTCVAVPKTIDNDLPVTDCSPGFGSAAKYTAVSVLEASLDVASMASTSTKVFVYEAMGRHAGWLAAAAGLAARKPGDAPQVILLPELPFDQDRFLAKVKATVESVGWCTVVVSEGVRTADGKFLAEAGGRDAFGHAQLGGAAPALARLVTAQLGYKHHWAVSDYLQRSARHVASATDLAQAQAVGTAAVEYALAGRNAVLPAIRRLSDDPYRWDIVPAPLEQVANREKMMPKSFISKDGFGITAAARRYLAPLIAGEAATVWRDGLPVVAQLKLKLTRKRLPAWGG